MQQNPQIQLDGVTPANLLVSSMTAELISPTCLWAVIGGVWNWDLSCFRWMFYWLSYAGFAKNTLNLTDVLSEDPKGTSKLS